jgi:hypothetical protein
MLNTRQQPTGPRMHKQNRLTLPSRSTRSANPMNICLSATRQIKVNHMADSRNVQTTEAATSVATTTFN